MSIANSINVHEEPILDSTNDAVSGAAGASAAITYAAGGAGVQHCIGGVAWSYSAAPTGGGLKIEDGSGNIVFQIDITAAGPGFIPFTPPRKGAANTALIVTLFAPGGAVVGKLSVLGHWTEGPNP
jgi:hypothetical protein